MHRISNKTLAVVFALGAPAAILFAACGPSARKAETPGSAAEEAPAVAAAKVVRRDLSRQVVLTAEFIPFQEVDVLAKVSGYVKDIPVDVGTHVQQGQVLATIEIPEMQDDIVRAQATIDQAEAEVAGGRDDVHRTESVHEIAHLSYQRLSDVVKERPGLVAQQEIDDAHGRDLVAEAQLASARSHLEAAIHKVSVTRAEFARVKTMLAYTRVTAPFAGVITKRYANTGSMIQAGTASQTQALPLVRLSENSRLRLILPVPESVVSLIKVGQALSVRVPTMNRTFPGQVARFSDRVQSSTRTMDTEVDVPNGGFSLVPGMYAEVTLTTDTRTQAVTVPITAVDLAGRAETAGKVMTVAADGRLESHEVSLGLQTADSFEVRSGLAQGDVVVIGNRASLRQGQHVRPKLVDFAAPAAP